MPEITIATSIIPRNFDLQRAAIDSWCKLGFKVISLNSAAEAAIVAEHFPDIPLKVVNRTAEATTGKPYIFFDDVLSTLTEVETDICGIVNSDIILMADAGFADFIAKTVGNGLLFGSRIDVDSMANPDGEEYLSGFDFFFFNKTALKIFPETGFCLGAPWWDYWAPIALLMTGIPCKELISPLAFHLKHETKWAGELFFDYGKMFADRISQYAQQPGLTGKITNASSPEELSAFSVDVLEFILKNSGKVVYPLPGNGDLRITVGRRQYLAMRDKVIELNKYCCALNAHLKVAGNAVPFGNAGVEARLAALESSLSWRITGPLRRMVDKIRQF